MEDKANLDLKKNGTGVDLYEGLSRLNNELSNMHRELAKKNVELAQLNEEKNRFVGMAAHDIRKPLALIINYSEILKEEISPMLDQEQAEFLSIIEKTGRSALEVVNSFLDIAKIESGKLELILQPGDLMEHVRQVMPFNRRLAQKKNIALLINNEHAVIPAVFDGRKIDQVLDNLVSNAIKFSAAGTTVAIAVASEAARIVVSVSNQGQGIPGCELDRLFKPFGRTSVQSTAGESSTGLGLAISKKIVVAHGGAIWVESTEGQGTAFFFSLPIRE